MTSHVNPKTKMVSTFLTVGLALACIGSAVAIEGGCESFKGNNKADCAFLTDLYEATDGKNWGKSTNWNTATSVCDWFGVFCDGGDRVNRTEVPSNNLHGSIPSSIVNTKLFGFDVSGNEITGTIPESIGSVTTLWGTNFADPEGDLGFVGTIPSSLGKLTRLQLLGLPHNRLTGSIPVNLASLSHLRVISFANNSLTGPLDEALCPMISNLQHCFLSDNDFKCPIPDCFANCDIQHCDAGQVPTGSILLSLAWVVSIIVTNA